MRYPNAQYMPPQPAICRALVLPFHREDLPALRQRTSKRPKQPVGS